MSDNTNTHDTLLLIIRENGIISEYQRQLYEASLLGINRVLYCLVCDFNENSKYNRLDEAVEKLDMVCDILKIQSLDKTITVWNSSLIGSRVVKTNSEGIITGISDSNYFDCYKEKNGSILQKRKRVGEVLAKSMAKKVSCMN